MGQLLRGDLGQSIINRTEVTFELAYRLPATIEMIIGALIIGVLVGVYGRRRLGRPSQFVV